MSGLTPAEMASLNARRDAAIREEIIGEWGDPLPRFPGWEDIALIFAHRMGMCGCEGEGVCYVV